MIWTVKKGAYRAFQGVMKVTGFVLPIPIPELLIGAGSIKKLAETVKKRKLTNILVVTDKVLTGLGLARGMLDSLAEQGVAVTIFDDVQPNPTIGNIEAGLKCYLANNCQGIIAFGGGSPMDCAKMIGARASNPNRTVVKMRGLFKVWRKPPPIFAVPTTAGTGSETTIAAVISNPETHEKFIVMDFKLVPQLAVLDSELMRGLPPDITAATGMDALTHAVEAYIGRHGTRFRNEKAEKAVKIIFDDLEAVYQDGSDLTRRENMALASFYAGVAFTRASVGYVHAVAHNLGGLYGVPHGLANAVILPYVLEISRTDAEEKLARLAVAGGIGQADETSETLSRRFIEKIKAMNRNMNIPETIRELQEKDIPLIAKRALKEANPLYPVPTILDQSQCEALIRRLLP